MSVHLFVMLLLFVCESPGAVLFVVTGIIAIESRQLEVRIMRQKGVHSVHTYPSYLKVSESVVWVEEWVLSCVPNFVLVNVYYPHKLTPFHIISVYGGVGGGQGAGGLPTERRGAQGFC